jgi:hypothetical protein
MSYQLNDDTISKSINNQHQMISINDQYQHQRSASASTIRMSINDQHQHQ